MPARHFTRRGCPGAAGVRFPASHARNQDSAGGNRHQHPATHHPDYSSHLAVRRWGLAGKLYTLNRKDLDVYRLGLCVNHRIRIGYR